MHRDVPCRKPSWAALLHLKMLSILGMIAKLDPTNVLHQHGHNVLLSSKYKKSWFLTMRSVCLQYGLLDPLLILQLRRNGNGSLSSRLQHWEAKVRAQAEVLPSLEYFDSRLLT